MKPILTMIILLFWFTAAASPVWEFRHPVPEPSLDTGIFWDVNASKLLAVGYDLDRNGKADYYTLRVIIRAFFSTDSGEFVAKNFPRKPIFFVDFEKDRMFYVAASKPIFYAYDFDEDGHFDLMFKDPLEDGINGNEEYYDRPSENVS